MANLYDLKKFDLNLLVIFECIYQHLSISKAAETLYITPSAVSQSLQRLRTQFNDPLFIRSGKGITPTVTGANLHQHLEQNLNKLEQTINIMHGSSLKNKFVIYSPQITTTLGVTELINSLRKNSDVEIEHHDILMSTETAENILAYRKADLIISTVPVHNRSIVCTLFKTVESVLVCSRNHPRMVEHSTLEDIMREQFTLFITTQPGVQEQQSAANNLFLNRKIGFSSDSLTSITNIIASTDIIGLLPKIIYEQNAVALNLKEISVDFKLPSVKLFLMYNRSSLNNKSFAEYIKTITP
ncbi:MULTISPECIES: DNA-binding transcriptional repressor CitR [Citrobacter]|jgi:DNA-binding transcriptional LysR family regulator|uniref:LysR-family transcriptional regulator VC0068 n=1 Tax=Citrobacter europaeus TaxID=1914243 RepID=A0ABY0JVI6_9ENTR|nr:MULTISPECIES: LysR family transcriptional regulator [Citrobacter]ATX02050.1 LysR family transcriptional regulator [Citrobacter freundii]NRF58322.1 LysR family transcriptional regulator [Citrobacter braakii]AUT98079.1 LysR family transcriptional regulator [Citrobacter freundii]MBY1056516.1 LysR family transcriptional regulator [Citrobacter europaeus]MCB6777286.1 LysR family transcriptional regulator [Citrobacter sp. 210820-DFI.7.8]